MGRMKEKFEELMEEHGLVYEDDGQQQQAEQEQQQQEEEGKPRPIESGEDKNNG